MITVGPRANSQHQTSMQLLSVNSQPLPLAIKSDIRSTMSVSPIVSNELTEAQQAIRDKLAKMKQMFEDDEEQEKVDV